MDYNREITFAEDLQFAEIQVRRRRQNEYVSEWRLTGGALDVHSRTVWSCTRPLSAHSVGTGRWASHCRRDGGQTDDEIVQSKACNYYPSTRLHCV